jgi:hypothetical protein
MDGPESVKVLYDAELNARIQFGINTSSELLAFIGNGGLQAMVYAGTELWRNNPNKNDKIFVDSYKFKTNQKLGYIAFMKGFKIRFIMNLRAASAQAARAARYP